MRQPHPNSRVSIVPHNQLLAAVTSIKQSEKRSRKLVEAVDELFAIFDAALIDQGCHFGEELWKCVHHIGRRERPDAEEPVVDDGDQPRKVVDPLRQLRITVVGDGASERHFCIGVEVLHQHRENRSANVFEE